jgi:5-methyltetrahydrofolate--homocysteine methyltransferase
MLDVNAGIPLADEPALLVRAIQEVQAVTDVPIAIDSSIVEALEAAIEIYEGKPLINSVTGEEEVLERVLPFVAKHGAAVVAISNDETGISEDPNVRFEVAKKIVNRAADYGIPAADVVVDPLVMPIGAMGTAGRQVFELVGRLRDELKVNTTCGASNVSFGLPNRHNITGTFLAMSIGAGMTSAIMNPLHGEVKTAIMAADVLNGQDENCAAWIAANRDPGEAGEGARGGRRGGRRRAAAAGS